MFIIRRSYLFHFSYPKIFFLNMIFASTSSSPLWQCNTLFNRHLYPALFEKRASPTFSGHHSAVCDVSSLPINVSCFFLNVALTVSNWFMYCSCNSNFFSFKMDMLNNRHNTPRMTRLARDIV